VSIETGEFRSQNTLRSYAGTAAFYPKTVRKNFCWDKIPFSHFVFAKSLQGNVENPNGAVPAWEVCLQYSMDYTDQNGYCTTEKKLRELFNDYLPMRVSTPPVGIPVAQGFIPYDTSDADIDGDETSVDRTFKQRVSDLFGFLPLLSTLWSSEKEQRVQKLLERLKREIDND
jgi:hypothetical protein